MIKRNIKRAIKSLEAFLLFYKFLIYETKKIKKADFLFILPYFQTGGAERIHLNIVKSVGDKNLCILFTHNSATQNFKNSFKQQASIIEINKILNKKNRYVNEVIKKQLCRILNKHKYLKTIFSSNTNFFYEIAPYLNKETIKIDLIHAISNENETIVNHYINTSKLINYRIVINNKAREDLIDAYIEQNVEEQYFDKIKIIENAIEIDGLDKLETRQNIKVGFVGRWSKEKRPEIILEIAKQIKKDFPSIEFIMAGIGMRSNLAKINHSGITFLGEITDYKELKNVYKTITFLLITSYREGFPVVIMEAMSQGAIPICTDVGGIRERITSFENGILIDNDQDESIITANFVKTIRTLINDQDLIDQMSKNVFNYSRTHFNLDKFNKAYRNYILNE